MTDQEWIITDAIESLRSLLCELTRQMVENYKKMAIDADLVMVLTSDQIEVERDSGKIGFGRKYGEGQVSVQKAQDTMLLAFEDGLFRVFQNDEELTKLDDQIKLIEGDKIILVRFIMLAGSVFPYLI